MDSHDDESQTPSLNGSRRPAGLGLLAFRAPEDDLPPIPPPSTSPETATPGEGSPLEADGPSPSGAEWLNDGPHAEDESSTISSPGSSADEDTAPPVSKAALKRTFRKGVLLTTGTLSKFAAKTQGQQMVGLYRADAEDAESIGDPLAEMAHRRGGMVGKALSPDAQNALEAAMGLGSYIAKQFALAQQALKIDAELAGLPPVDGPVDL